MSGLRLDLRQAGITLSVTDHAQWQAAARFAICRAEALEDEVFAAFADGRVSAARPPGVRGAREPDALYAWVEGGGRVYVLLPDRNVGGTALCVVTVMAPLDPREPARG